MNHEALIEKALELGATKAAMIKESDIVTNIAFFDICKQNSCGQFGKCYCCPPDCGDAEELMARVRTYPGGLLYQTIWEIEDSFDIEGMGLAGKNHEKVSLRILREFKKLLPEDSWFLAAGGCGLCEVCGKRTGEPCRHPDLCMIGMEGACIDVSGTTRSTHLKYINGQNTVTYFGLILFREEE